MRPTRRRARCRRRGASRTCRSRWRSSRRRSPPTLSPSSECSTSSRTWRGTGGTSRSAPKPSTPCADPAVRLGRWASRGRLGSAARRGRWGCRGTLETGALTSRVPRARRAKWAPRGSPPPRPHPRRSRCGSIPRATGSRMCRTCRCGSQGRQWTGGRSRTGGRWGSGRPARPRRSRGCHARAHSSGTFPTTSTLSRARMRCWDISRRRS
mmetsp:Transcript_10069/g.24661  ORF Transcript_10069/g.24661 Transcript_10069/m.24661 type:complete len:210 (+) Transcript_10069:723-1352(+)